MAEKIFIFYVTSLIINFNIFLAKGKVEVIVDGKSRTHLNEGVYFGDLALLYNAPRSATIKAD